MVVVVVGPLPASIAVAHPRLTVRGVAARVPRPFWRCVAVKPLALKFKVDDLRAEGRPFEGALSVELLEGCLPGLVGTLGYRPQGPASVAGTLYRSSGGEIIVTGRLQAEVGFDCVRCLQSRTLPVDVSGDHVFVRRETPTQPKGRETVDLVVEDEDEDDDVSTYEGDEIDLHDTYREALLLELPMNPTCEHVQAEGCEALASDAPGEVDTVDPRWAPLLELKRRMGAANDEGAPPAKPARADNTD